MKRSLDIAYKKTDIRKSFFDEEGHLNDFASTLYVEARLLKRTEDLPDEVLTHIEECASCQREVFELYQILREEDISLLKPHKLLDKYKKQKQKSFKTRKTIFVKKWSKVAAIFLFLMLSTVFAVLFQQQTQEVVALDSPFQNVDINFKNIEVDNDKALSFKLENGTSIFVPAGTFVDKKGRTIQGKVKLKYREFHNAASLIASGVPLTYDSLGRAYNLESAGLFEIKGERDGKKVFIAKGKSIEVDMASFEDDKSFNHYYLSQSKVNKLAENPFITSAYAQTPKSNKWQYLGKSEEVLVSKGSTQITEITENSQSIIDSLIELKGESYREYQVRMAQMDSIQKEKQREKTANSQLFKLALDTKEHPELIQYEDITWKYMGENIQKSPLRANTWVFQEKWEELNLTPMKYRATSLRHDAAVNTATFSPNNRYIVTASDDKTAKIWLSDNASHHRTLTGHEAAVTSAVFAPNGKFVLTASKDGTAKIWNLNGNLVSTLNKHHNPIKNAEFSSNGLYILTQSENGKAMVWRNNGTFLFEVKHEHKIKKLMFAPNNKYVLSIGKDALAIVWDINSGKMLKTFAGYYNDIDISRNGKKILLAHNDGTEIWSFAGEKLYDIRGYASKAFFMSDGRTIVTVQKETAKLWKAHYGPTNNTAQLIRKLSTHEWMKKQKGHKSKIMNIKTSNNGGYIVSASTDKTAKVWTRDGWLLYTLREHTATVNDISVSPDGMQLITASDDNTAKLWNESQDGDVYELSLSKYGKTYIDSKGNPHRRKAKEFYTLVQKASVEELANNNNVFYPTEVFKEGYEIDAMIASEQSKSSGNRQYFEENKKLGKVLRKFKVTRFGIYQSARIYKDAGEIECRANFTVQKQEIAEDAKVYLVTGENQTVVKQYSKYNNYIKFNPNSNNQLLAVLPEDKVAFLTQLEFSKIDREKLQKDKKQNFDFKNVASIASVRKLEERLDY